MANRKRESVQKGDTKAFKMHIKMIYHVRVELHILNMMYAPFHTHLYVVNRHMRI